MFYMSCNLLAQNSWTNRIQSNITHLHVCRHTSILSALLTLSAVHDPTFSFNAFLFRPNTPPPFCHLVTRIRRSLYIAIALWNKLPLALSKLSDPSCELTKSPPLAISPQLFHS